MARGVNKIDIATNQVNAKVLSRSGNRICVEADKYIWFKVSEWMSGTTDNDKKKGTIWLRQDNERRKVVNKKDVGADEVFGYAFKKKECGASAYYYIEATLFGSRDGKNTTGLFVKGFSPALIVKSKWCTQNDGADQRSRKFSFGENVFLGLETEGINQQTITIELYRLNSEVTLGKVSDRIFDKNYDPTKDDIKAKVFEKQAKVIDGEINTEFTILPSWKKGNDDHLFYVKVRDGKNYVKDNKGQIIHGRYLKVKNNIVPTKNKIVELSNNAPVKVGEANKNVKVSHLCKFVQINIDDNGQNFEVFKEGKTSLKKTSPVVQFTTYRVHFNFDKSDIRPEAREILKYLLDFLLYNQHLDMALSGHADDRGTLDYNQALSERRAQAVKDFFVNGGLDKNRIKTKGFGEVNPIASGKTEEAYKKNRRVEIEFSYLEYNQDALFYETLAPDAKKMKEIKVNVVGRTEKGCFRKEKHNKNIIYVNETGGKNLVTKNGNSVKQIIFSQQSGFPSNYGLLLAKFLNPLSTIYYQFAFHINSCAYYADKSKATLEVRVYPDVVWIGHFQYNYKESGTYFFHEKNFDLETGIGDVIDEITNSTLFKISKILPSQWIQEYVVLPYIKKQAMDYTYGIHTIHNRTLEKTGEALSLVGTQTNLIKQTLYTKYVAAAVIYGFVIVGIIIDLLMIYLTRGKNLQGRLLKLSKAVKGAERVLKTMNDAGADIIPPSIAINAGMYYQKQLNGKLALVYEANISAKPVVAVSFKREFDLLDLLKKGIESIKGAMHPKDEKTKKKLDEGKKNNTKITEYFESLKKNIQIKGTFDAVGELIFEQNIQYNFLTNSHTFIDKIGNLAQTARNEMTIKDQVKFNATVNGQFRKEFNFFRLQTKVEGKVEVNLKGGAGLKLEYGVDMGGRYNKKAKGLYVTPSIFCSGVEGTYLGSLKVSNAVTEILDFGDYSTNEGKPMPFVLIEPFEVSLFEIQLFKEK